VPARWHDVRLRLHVGGRSAAVDHSKNWRRKSASLVVPCNFTNLYAKPENYLSNNPHFCRSALARYTPQHFITWLNQQGIGYHEKKLGQLFCDEGSAAIIAMLRNECDAAGVRWLMPCEVHKVKRLNPPFRQAGERQKWGNTHPLAERFSCNTNRHISHAVRGDCKWYSSIPKIGATPFVTKSRSNLIFP
jgi:predicted flavoprotein YhiN